MNQRKKRAKDYLSQNSDLSPIATNRKNLAVSATGKHWCWLVHLIVENPYALEEGRRIVRSGEIVDFAFDVDHFVFRCTVLYGEASCYTVEMSCCDISDEHRDFVFSELKKHSHDLNSMLQGSQDDELNWMFDAGKGVLPPVENIKLDCDCTHYDCAHKAAALYAFGVRLDQNPIAVFEIQKISRSTILDLLTCLDSSADDAEALSQRFGFDLLDIDM
jgi:uncharacterized Zn finger protein